MENAAHHHAGPRGGGDDAARRAQRRWGLDRLRLIHGGPDGADPEADEPEDLARALHRELRHRPVVLLHDRRVPSAPIIDHVAIGPGGVTVIAAARDLRPPLRLERVAGVFGARAEGLHDAIGDRTDRIVAVREQVFALRRLLEDSVSVKGALCPQFRGGAAPMPLTVGGILVAGPRTVADLAWRDPQSMELDFAPFVDRLDRALEPVFGRPH